MGKFTVHLTFFLVVQIVCASSVVGEGCENRQNLELYQPGIIQCSLEAGFFGVQWFNSTEEETSAFITYVRDVKDGPGFSSGDYDVWLNGSLFVRNVTVEHERVFIVTHAPSASGQTKQYNIQVQLFVKPQLEYPVIKECQDKSKICYMLYEKPLELSCSVENVRPRISVIWNQRNSQRDKLLESNMTQIRNNEVTFTTRSTVKIHNDSPLLSVLVCSVNENTWILEENETVVILENGSVDISHSPIRHPVELHTTMTLPCNDFNESILVWKRSTDRSETPEVILIRVQTWKEDFNETYNKDFRLKPDGSLMLPQTELYHQGIYTCVSSDYDMDHIQTIDVVIFNLSIFVEGVFESTFIELQASHSPIIIGVIYCPSGVSETVLDMFSTLFISLNREDRSCFLMGDFNCNLLITSENIATQHKIPNVNSHYKMYLQAPVIDSLFIIPATRDEVLKVLLSLKPSAAGFDGVSAIIVKHVAHSLCIPLTYLCNLSFELGVVPKSLKIARVVPVFKAGEKESVNNYRPISVLPCFSKHLVLQDKVDHYEGHESEVFCSQSSCHRLKLVEYCTHHPPCDTNNYIRFVIKLILQFMATVEGTCFSKTLAPTEKGLP
ncbi:hypothetical protein BSL78_16242 [Apostichopus japonicus]|uniref:Ig-like domain-containing protein n=1 Tax=Stichopus japonicus TaxID=307972 RepID=A0A2G8KG09_STIJA|nr:hypothetical protein BSL78_16242 [Apostichopus japonicus]